MAKTKTTFICQSCGIESAKWQGKCPSCNSWNTFVEEIIQKESKKENWKEDEVGRSSTSKKLNEIEETENQRIITEDAELNRVLGGGIVLGSVILVAGEPGIGKSTLFLQASLQLKNCTTLYISGEESLQQIKLRAERIKIPNEHFYLLTATETQAIFNEVKKIKPEAMNSHEEPTFINLPKTSASSLVNCSLRLYLKISTPDSSSHTRM